MPWLYILIFVGSCLVLVRSGTWVIRSLTRIARVLEWSKFLVAFVLMAFATSLPELFVGITSALHHQPELSFGNVIGSNIINLTLIVALAVFLASGLKLKRKVARTDSLLTALFAFLPILMILDGSLSRPDGVILLVALWIYLTFLFKRRAKRVKAFSNSLIRDLPRFKSFLKDIGLFLGGIGLLLLSAEGIVWSASSFAEAFGLPLITLGILIVALGTNLPEIVFGVKAVAMGHKEMVLGNLMGSVIANSTLVLGVTVLIYPLQIFKLSPYLVGIIFTVFTALFFAIFARTDRKITRKEALALLSIYVLFVASQLLIR